MPSVHLAIDLGASSGRAMIGMLDGDPVQLSLAELHRFEHRPCPTPTGPVWDLTGIWLNILEGLRQASQWCRKRGYRLDSVGVDAWGVDWALLGESGELLGLSHCYRDPQNEAAAERVLAQVGGREALYARTGIQHMSINTLFQVAARHQCEPRLFDAARHLVFIPDLFHYWLSGNITTERTIASTSSMISVATGTWDRELLEAIGIPSTMLGDLIEPGSPVGHLQAEVCQLTGLNEGVRVIAPGAHDTASAVAAVPVSGTDRASTDAGQTPDWAYLSSGTWSLLGMELDAAVVTPESCAAPFTNEMGLAHQVRFLKNIAGLWLIQELRRERVQNGEEVDFDELVQLAKSSPPFRTLIDPNASRFAAPGQMAEKIRSFARETSQPNPDSIGDLARCCLDSLALCYLETIERLESIMQVRINRLHIVGGGTQNRLLNRITCGVLQRDVVCGPVEATAIGNLLTQAIGCGQLGGLSDLRAVVCRSFPLEYYSVDDCDLRLIPDADVIARYRSILNRG